MQISTNGNWGRYRYAEERRVARLPCCDNRTNGGSNWKLLILRNLLARPWRFNELRKNLEGISQKFLDGQPALNGEEDSSIITRTVSSEGPPRVEYSFERIRRIDAPYY